MLIQPSHQAQTTYYTGADSSTNSTGVNQASARGAIPPVEASGKDEAAQNQFFDTGATLPERVEPGAKGDSKAAETVNSEQADLDASDKSKADARKQVEQQQQLEDQLVVDQLKARDREVRVHEAAHASVGGQYAGSPNFEYTRGPDGKNYATGGEVSISVSEANDPQATIEKARVIQAAALAPAQPSSQDRQVAAQAARMELNAQAELQQQKSAEAQAEKQAGDKEVNEAADSAEPSETGGESQLSTDNSFQYISQFGSNDAAEVVADSAKSKAESSQNGANASGNSSPVSAYIQQLHQQGPADLQNPYGKRGQLNILA